MIAIAREMEPKRTNTLRGPIPPELAARMFEPFASGNAGQAHLGLGLFIARAIMRAHGGSVDVRSAEGKTVFCARLPR